MSAGGSGVQRLEAPERRLREAAVGNAPRAELLGGIQIPVAGRRPMPRWSPSPSRMRLRDCSTSDRPMSAHSWNPQASKAHSARRRTWATLLGVSPLAASPAYQSSTRLWRGSGARRLSTPNAASWPRMLHQALSAGEPGAGPVKVRVPQPRRSSRPLTAVRPHGRPSNARSPTPAAQP